MKKESVFRRLLAFAVVVAMLAAMTLPAMAAQSGVTFKKVDNSSVSAKLPGRDAAVLPEAEDAYADTDVVRVSIFLDRAATLEAGYSAETVGTNVFAKWYRNNLKKDQSKLISKIEKATGEKLDVVWNLTLAANLISANVPFGQIEEIEAMAGVRTVVIETQYELDVVSKGDADPNMATSGVQTGTGPAWAAGYTGAGSRVAIIDTGLDVEHEAFDAGAYEYALAYLAGKSGKTIEEYKAGLDLLDAEEIAGVLSQLNAYEWAGVSAEDLYVNSKVPFGFNYVDVDLDLSHYNSEHGSHVAGIAAANSYVAEGDGYVSALDSTFVQGVAPDAQLIVMKVFGASGGAYDSDYMAAIEDAILLGADSVNLSLGSGNPGMTKPSVAEYQAILDSVQGSGVVLSISAGNSGSWVEMADNAGYLYADDVSMHTGGSPGSFTNSLGVASVDNAGFVTTLMPIVMVGDAGVFYYDDNNYQGGGTYGNKPFSTLAGDYEYVFLNNIGTPEQFAALGEGALEGKIAMCYRGETSFFEKANAAVAAGAIGVIIVNNVDEIFGMNLSGYEYDAPAVSISLSSGEIFKVNPITDENGELLGWTGTLTVPETAAPGLYPNDYTMSSFSSWGVPGSLIMKPEITAPGGNIYSVAGDVPGFFEGHDNYELMSGTSMAAPQVAGMSALLAQYIKEAGLEEKTGLDARTLAQSLLMSTAEPMIDNGTSYYPVLQQGAGLANVGAAIMADTYIMMGADATASYADGKVKVELGDDPDRTGEYSFTFTINNLTEEDKLYNLSADFFIQAPTSDGRNLYMYTSTALIGALTTFTVNGEVVDAVYGMDGMDFNGDGVVNTLDGQALLDYATGLRTELFNADKADIDGDDDIDSFDAYLFLAAAEAITTVPAGGSVEVTVNVTIPDDWKADIDYFYPNGTYIQGFVYADGVSSDEGVAGTSHSIPVLGFFGNWSDPSMYDKGSAMEYIYGLENRIPYLYSYTLGVGYSNGLLYKDEAGNEYWFGGNPMVDDGVYLPERNAISPTSGYELSMLGFTTIRNAAAAYFEIWNSETGEYYAHQDVTGGKPLYSAYYYDNGGYWDNEYWQLNLNFNPEGIPNNTPIEVGVTSVLEYYVDEEGNIDWDALGAGATFSMPMVVDSEAPVLKDASIGLMDNKLKVKASDNQYIAAVALFDIYGQYLYTYNGADLEQNAGDTVEFALDLAEVNGPSFLLQVYDYAMNTTTYEIKTQIGEVTNEIESVKISNTALIMQKGNTDSLSAIVYPVNAMSRDVAWTSSDESVVTVDENGVLTAVEVGTAVVTATSVADENFYATCYVEVIDINIDLNGIVWDEEGSIWFSEFNTTTLPEYVKLSGDMLDTDYMVASTMDTEGNLYASSLNTSTGTGSVYRIDPVTYEATKLADCVVDGLRIFYSDLTYAPGMYGTGCLLGTYGPFVITIDPATGEAIEIIDQYDSYLVGIASCYGDPWSGNCVYAIQNDGTVIQEIYIDAGMLDSSLAGMVIPYSMLMGSRAAMDTGISVGDSWYFNSAYYDSESALLFWSAFDIAADDNDVELFAIDADYSGNVYSMGTFAPGVWPVGGLFELNDYDYAYGETSVRSAEDIKAACDAYVAANGVPALEQFKLAKQDLIVKTQAAATPLVPMSATEVDTAEDYVTVTITAGGPELEAVALSETLYTNGVTTVTYDASALELISVSMVADYTSINQGEGAVTLGYVQMDGYAADDVVATLTFAVKDTSVETITVTYEEINNDHPETVEELPINYPHANTEVKDAKEPTCTEEGYTGDTYCTDCGKLIAKGEVIPAKGHGETEIKDAKEATCTEAGYTGDTWCTVCNTKIADGEVIPAAGHTCTSVVTPPTCTEEGYTTHTCIDCGEVIITDKVPATGHTFENYVSDGNATCTEDGTKTAKCEHCDATDTVTDEGSAKGHGETEIKDAKDATCTEEGYTGDTYCTVCGEKIADGEAIPAKGHGETEIKDAKDATCTEEGYTGDTYCTDCGEKLADGEAIPAKGHGETEIKDAKPATTTEEGYTGDTYCTDCGEKIAEGETIAKVDPENPKTSQDTRAFLMASVAVMIAAAAAAVVMLNRKKMF